MKRTAPSTSFIILFVSHHRLAHSPNLKSASKQRCFKCVTNSVYLLIRKLYSSPDLFLSFRHQWDCQKFRLHMAALMRHIPDNDLKWSIAKDHRLHISILHSEEISVTFWLSDSYALFEEVCHSVRILSRTRVSNNQYRSKNLGQAIHTTYMLPHSF